LIQKVKNEHSENFASVLCIGLNVLIRNCFFLKLRKLKPIKHYDSID